MLENLKKPLMMRHHALSGGVFADIHNTLEDALVIEQQDLQDLIDRDPILVEGYSEQEVQELINRQTLHTTYILYQVIESNGNLPLTDQYNHIG